MEQPYTLSDYFSRYLLSPTAWTPQEKLAELSRKYGFGIIIWPALTIVALVLKADDVQKHIPEFLSRIHLQTFVHGNMKKDVGFHPSVSNRG